MTSFCFRFMKWTCAVSILLISVYQWRKQYFYVASTHLEGYSQDLMQMSASESQSIRRNHSESTTVVPILTDYNATRLHNAWRSVPVLDAPHFPRMLTPDQLEANLNLLKSVVALFKHYNIEYIMCQGTLLGSYITHSILPWDDDIDLFMHARYVDKLASLADDDTVSLREKTIKEFGLGLRIMCQIHGRDKDGTCMLQKFKLWRLDAPLESKYHWKIPSLDVAIYDNNNTHAWLRDPVPWVFPLEVFYPLQKRPLNGLWLSAPREPYPLLVSHYSYFGRLRGHHNQPQMKCIYPDYSHWHQRLMKSSWKKTECQAVGNFYPFVWRSKTSSGQTREDLIIGNVTYYSILTSETFLRKWQPQLHNTVFLEHWPRLYNEPLYVLTHNHTGHW